MLLGRRLFSMLLRPTVYSQFVAGEKKGEISQSMKKMSLLGMRPMLAVPIEEDLGESTGCELASERSVHHLNLHTVHHSPHALIAVESS